jgi:hypothetical protein
MDSSLPLKEEGSQLGIYQKIKLLIRNPREAFTLLSQAERRNDALVVFSLYFLVRFPVISQRLVIKGLTGDYDQANFAAYVIVGFVGGIVLTVLGLIIIGLFLDIILNRLLRAGRSLEDAITLVALSLTPQLLLMVEFPTLILHFDEHRTYSIFVILRLIVDVLSLRTFYWGLRSLFKLSTGKALSLVISPVILALSFVVFIIH